jgi:hypothetical protein
MEAENDENNDPEMLVRQAYISFSTAFSNYIKECDPALWIRARAYALDTAPMPKGVRLYMDEPKEDKDV